jgi:Rrf2 family protein
MFSLTKKTDYALLALCCLDQEPEGRPLNTKVIAERYRIPMELLAKILQQLARKGLVISTSGPAGGYRLARPAEEITVANVMNAVDGRPAIVLCFKSGRDACQQFETCTIRSPMALVQRRLAKVLNETTIRDLLTPELEPLEVAPLGAFRKN